MSERNFSPKKAFEALTPQPIIGYWNTSRSGVRVDIEPPRPGGTASSMPSAYVFVSDNVDVYDAAQMAVFFAKLSVHLGSNDIRVAAFAQSGGYE